MSSSSSSSEVDVDPNAGAAQKASGFGAMLASTLAMLSQKGGRGVEGAILRRDNAPKESTSAESTLVSLQATAGEPPSDGKGIHNTEPFSDDDPESEAESSELAADGTASKNAGIGALLHPRTDAGVDDTSRHATDTGEETRVGDGPSKSETGTDHTESNGKQLTQIDHSQVVTGEQAELHAGADAEEESLAPDTQGKIVRKAPDATTSHPADPSSDSPLPSNSNSEGNEAKSTSKNVGLGARHQGGTPAGAPSSLEDDAPAVGNRPLQMSGSDAASSTTIEDATEGSSAQRGAADEVQRPRMSAGASSADSPSRQGATSHRAATGSKTSPRIEPTPLNPDSKTQAKPGQDAELSRDHAQDVPAASSESASAASDSRMVGKDSVSAGVDSTSAGPVSGAAGKDSASAGIVSASGGTNSTSASELSNQKSPARSVAASSQPTTSEQRSGAGTHVEKKASAVHPDKERPTTVASERSIAGSDERTIARSDERTIAGSDERTIAGSDERTVASSDERTIARSNEKTNPTSGKGNGAASGERFNPTSGDQTVVTGSEQAAHRRVADLERASHLRPAERARLWQEAASAATKTKPAEEPASANTSSPSRAAAPSSPAPLNRVAADAVAESDGVVPKSQTNGVPTVGAAEDGAAKPAASSPETLAASTVSDQPPTAVGHVDERAERETRADSERSTSSSTSTDSIESGSTANGETGEQNDFLANTDTQPDDAFDVAADELSPDGLEFDAALQDETVTIDAPVDAPPAETSDRSTFTPERAQSPTTANPLAGAERTARPRQAGNLNWMQAMLEDSLEGLSLEDDWKVLEMSLDEGQGTMTVRARRDDDKVSITVNFSDPQLRALAAEHSDRLQETLRAQYETQVDFSLMNDNAGHSQQRRNGTSNDGGRGFENITTSLGGSISAVDLARATRAALAGARNEWVG